MFISELRALRKCYVIRVIALTERITTGLAFQLYIACVLMLAFVLVTR